MSALRKLHSPRKVNCVREREVARHGWSPVIFNPNKPQPVAEDAWEKKKRTDPFLSKFLGLEP